MQLQGRIVLHFFEINPFKSFFDQSMHCITLVLTCTRKAEMLLACVAEMANELFRFLFIFFRNFIFWRRCHKRSSRFSPIDLFRPPQKGEIQCRYFIITTTDLHKTKTLKIPTLALIAFKLVGDATMHRSSLFVLSVDTVLDFFGIHLVKMGRFYHATLRCCMRKSSCSTDKVDLSPLHAVVVVLRT